MGTSGATLQSKMEGPGGFTTGFDYLRIVLSVAVLVDHSVALSAGTDRAMWDGPWRFGLVLILPMFFALSGFLVTGSLQRVRLHQFFTLRLVRLIPALAVEITLSAIVIGLLVTTLPVATYLRSHEFLVYFLNIIGIIHYELPGVFASNPIPSIINAQLWTIPFELECYFSLAVLAILRIVNRRGLFAAAVAAVCVVATVKASIVHTGDHFSYVSGRMLVMCFLAAVTIYLYKDRLPFSHRLGIGALLLSAMLLEVPELRYLAAFPIAYATVWLGLMRPPAIPFGDLSYGVYLFHFPVEQCVVYALPEVRTWWALTLISLPLTAVCAWLSWTLIEHPVLVRKKLILSASDKIMDRLMRLVFGRARLTTEAQKPTRSAR